MTTYWSKFRYLAGHTCFVNDNIVFSEIIVLIVEVYMVNGIHI